MYRSVELFVVCSVVFLCAVFPNLARAQYDSRQDQIAKDAKNQSIYRVERAKARIQEVIEWIQSRSKENLDEILSAQFYCTKSEKKSTFLEIQNAFVRIEEQIKKSKEDEGLIKSSLDRKIGLLKNSYRRVCDERASRDLESYVICLSATEKLHTAAEIRAGFELLVLIQKSYAIEPIKKLKECYLSREVLENQAVLKAIESYAKTAFLVTDYINKLNDSVEELTGMR